MGLVTLDLKNGDDVAVAEAKSQGAFYLKISEEDEKVLHFDLLNNTHAHIL